MGSPNAAGVPSSSGPATLQKTDRLGQKRPPEEPGPDVRAVGWDHDFRYYGPRRPGCWVRATPAWEQRRFLCHAGDLPFGWLVWV